MRRPDSSKIDKKHVLHEKGKKTQHRQNDLHENKKFMFVNDFTIDTF